MYVMQITGMGAAKMSASYTWWKLWQQDNSSGSYNYKHKQWQANTNGLTQMRAGKCK
jgi:hypothetical protein